MKKIALTIIAALILAGCSAKPASQGGTMVNSNSGQNAASQAAGVPFNEEDVRSQLKVNTYLFDTGFSTMQAIVMVDNPTPYDLNLTCKIKMLFEDGTEAKSDEIARQSVDKGYGASFISTYEMDEKVPVKMEYELIKVEQDTSGNARLHNFEIKEEKTDNGEVVITVKNISDVEQDRLKAHMFTFNGDELMCVNTPTVGEKYQAPGKIWVSEPIRGTEPVEDKWKVYYFSEQ